jgi:predicted DNA-binding protein (UPF0251 family)
LRESICRDLVENGQLDSYPTTFRLTAFLISRGIRDRETIEELFDQRLLSYKDFQSEQPKVERLISSAKRHYFEKRKYIPDKIKADLWEKLETAWDNLSIKQRSALEIHIMSDDPISLEKGAKRLKISKASFKERVQSGIRKIRKSLPSPMPSTALNNSKRLTTIKQSQKTFKRKKNAPSMAELTRWIDATSITTQYLDMSSLFKKRKTTNSCD